MADRSCPTCGMGYWVSVKDDLPSNHQLVLIRGKFRTKVYGHGGIARNYHVAQFVRGKELKDNPNGPWTFGDEWGNNQRPYEWRGDGPCGWFGQDVTHWAPIHEPDEVFP